MRCPFSRVVRLLILALVVVLLTSAAAQPPLILVPASKPRFATYYQHGQAFTSGTAESTSVLLSADICKLFGTTYLRVWLLYFSRMDHPVLLDPVHTVEAKVVDTNHGYDLLDPVLPYQLLAEAENAKTRAMIGAVIGGALQSVGTAMSTSPTTFRTSDGQSGTINDRDDKIEARTQAIDQRTELRVGEIQSAHEMFEASFNAGALRKHTVFPQSGVNGYIYIPLPAHDVIERHGGIPFFKGKRWQEGDVLYWVTFYLPGVVDTLCFYPDAGE